MLEYLICLQASLELFLKMIMLIKLVAFLMRTSSHNDSLKANGRNYAAWRSYLF